MTVADAIRTATHRLSQTSDTARLDAELLMAHALGVSRSDMLVRYMGEPAPDTFTELIDRRAAYEPVAYITGQQEFYGRTFKVTPDVLIPRGDSETLIEAALASKPGAGRVLDLGTGSGALLITMLAETQARGLGMDRSTPALEVARGNARQMGVADRAAFRVADWHIDGWADDLEPFDLILCNPPYVEDEARLDRDVRDYEPASALFAGPEGLDDYRALIPNLRKLTNRESVVIFEIGASQAEAVQQMAQKAGFSVEIRLDLANRPRCAILR